MGHPLDAAARDFAEARLGADLGEVRVHTDAQAAESAQGLQAQAYTMGNNIVFGAGTYAPETAAGKRLLLHELTHVMQQETAPISSTVNAENVSLSHPSDVSEQQADQTADRLMQGEAAGSITAVSGASGPTIQRQAIPGTPEVALRPSPFVARGLGSLTLEGFAVDSATLTAAHQTQIAALALRIIQLRQTYPNGTVSITGHTDATGSEAHNFTLGEERAAAASEALVAAGVPADTITTSSAGESELRTPVQHATPQNRRVEIRFAPETGFQFAPLLPSLELRPPGTSSGTQTPFSSERVFDFRLPPSYLSETPTERMQRILAPVPEISRPRTAVSQFAHERLEGNLNSLMRDLNIPPWAQRLIRQGAHAALNKAAEELLDVALDQTQIRGEQREAIQATVRAAFQWQF